MADLIVVGDRVLIDPKTGEEKTDTGLVVPASVSDQENVQSGRVVKTGPGYLTQNPEYSETESWKELTTPVRYLPLQANPGDHAFFLRNEAIDLRYDEKHYLVVPHQAIVALLRADDHDGSGNGDGPADGGDDPNGPSLDGPDAPREEPSDTTVEDIEDLWDDDDDDADTPDPGQLA